MGGMCLAAEPSQGHVVRGKSSAVWALGESKTGRGGESHAGTGQTLHKKAPDKRP